MLSVHKELRTDAAPTPAGFYSQAVLAGEMLFISGQLPFDTEGNLVEGDARQQTAATLRNIQHILHAAGADQDNLVQVTVYVSDIELWPEVNAVYEAFLRDVPIPPARAVVPARELHYGASVEIQAVAYLEAPSNHPC